MHENEIKINQNNTKKNPSKIKINKFWNYLLPFLVEHCVNPPKCTNGGFVNHDCVCYCPRGYKGETCEKVITDEGIDIRDCSFFLFGPFYISYQNEIELLNIFKFAINVFWELFILLECYINLTYREKVVVEW